ncbi:oligopeptide/dipeptide ABC transporter ATP-binding protein [Rhodophyticola sp.]|uniref:oligopeptide/dipeptide ABC transporter ATP-binding protein n=1 Tax=Rhodophyticola sp. TaxID=2680032 RepID=UPI003D2E1A57
MSLPLISHDLGVIADMADRVAVMYGGRVVEVGAVATVLDAPAHPYTRGLLAALPDLDGPRTRLMAIPGAVPAPDALPPGCFARRCAHVDGVCETAPPPLRALPDAPARHAACALIEALWHGKNSLKTASQTLERTSA